MTIYNLLGHKLHIKKRKIDILAFIFRRYYDYREWVYFNVLECTSGLAEGLEYGHDKPNSY